VICDEIVVLALPGVLAAMILGYYCRGGGICGLRWLMPWAAWPMRTDLGRPGLGVAVSPGAGVMRVEVLVGEEVAVVRGCFVSGSPTILE